jgi:hypothetical protein
MVDKPLVAAYDPFPSRPFHRLDRRRLLAEVAGSLDVLVVVDSGNERDLQTAAERCRREGIEAILAGRPTTPDASDAFAHRARVLGFGGVLAASVACADAARAIAARAVVHGRVILQIDERDLGLVGVGLEPSVDVVWRPRAAAVPEGAIAGIAAMLGRRPIIELAPGDDPGRPALEPPGRAPILGAAGAGGVLLHPPSRPETAAIWLELAASADPDALERLLGDRYGAADARRLQALSGAVARCGIPRELVDARRALLAGDRGPLRAVLREWVGLGDAVARLADRRLAGEIAPLAGQLHALGSAGLLALDGDREAARDVYEARLAGADSALGPAAAALLDLVA